MKKKCRVFYGLIAAFVLQCGCGDDTNAAANVSPDDGVRIDCVDRINGFRATEGLPPLARWVDGEVCADSEARSDAQSGVPHGAFGQCSENAQNECPGWNSVEQIIDGCLQGMWDEGPGEPYSEHGHYINMSSERYTKVACGFFESAAGVWAVQNFQ